MRPRTGFGLRRASLVLGSRTLGSARPAGPLAKRILGLHDFHSAAGLALARPMRGLAALGQLATLRDLRVDAVG